MVLSFILDLIFEPAYPLVTFEMVTFGVISDNKSRLMEGVVINLQGHVRHNWKTRKFILCTEPTMLFYCRPSKVKNVCSLSVEGNLKIVVY